MKQQRRTNQYRCRACVSFIGVFLMVGQALAQQSPTIKQLARRAKPNWCVTQEARQVADSVMKYQFPSGGWAKNQNWHMPAEGNKQAERLLVWQQIHSDSGVGATIDNGATINEMQVLARIYQANATYNKADRKQQKRIRKAVVKGFDYLIEAQYDNGGWPQYYPKKPARKDGQPFYSDHITFNDYAMTNVMQLLRDIADNKEPWAALQFDPAQRQLARNAFEKGIECILNCQIRKNGQLTVWCQQHDEHTLQPANARAYELASFTGTHETVAILQMLMSLPQPSQRVKESVEAAIAWLQRHAIRDMRQETFVNADGKQDRRLVHQFGANLWARYYDLETEEPFVCDRDGKPQPALEYIGYERRNGYGWYSSDTQTVIDAYDNWRKNH